jgi:hypothetical protein
LCVPRATAGPRLPPRDPHCPTQRHEAVRPKASGNAAC